MCFSNLGIVWLGNRKADIWKGEIKDGISNAPRQSHLTPLSVIPFRLFKSSDRVKFYSNIVLHCPFPVQVPTPLPLNNLLILLWIPGSRRFTAKGHKRPVLLTLSLDTVGWKRIPTSVKVEEYRLGFLPSDHRLDHHHVPSNYKHSCDLGQTATNETNQTLCFTYTRYNIKNLVNCLWY